MGEIIQTYMPVTSGSFDKEEIKRSMLIDEYIKNNRVGLVGPYICVVNEKPISRAHWGSYIVKTSDTVVFLAFPQGGGDGGSNPIKTIALIAVAAFAFTTGTWLLGMGATPFVQGAVSGLIMAGGSYLVNVAFPPEKPEFDIQSGTTRAGTSLSTYNINDRGNNSALNNIIPVQYGRLKRYPQYAMQSWSQFENNEQYAYLLFCHGQGEYEFEDFYFASKEKLYCLWILLKNAPAACPHFCSTAAADHTIIAVFDGAAVMEILLPLSSSFQCPTNPGRPSVGEYISLGSKTRL